MPSPAVQYTDSSDDQQAQPSWCRGDRRGTPTDGYCGRGWSTQRGDCSTDVVCFRQAISATSSADFVHIDEILGEAVHALELSDETRLFPRAIRDAAQRKMLEDYLAQLRLSLKAFIDTQVLQDITRPVRGLVPPYRDHLRADSRNGPATHVHEPVRSPAGGCRRGQ